MDFGDTDIDPHGDRPITSATARDVLSTPRWAYLLFELSIIDRQDGPQTATELAERLQLSPDTVADDLDELASREAVRVTSQSKPRYSSEGCYFYPENWVELPDGTRVEMLPRPLFGAVGYAHTDAAAEQLLDEHGYEPFHDGVSVYLSTVLDDESEYRFEELFPEVPDGDVAPLRRALDYAYSRLSEDPLWVETYDTEATVEE